MLDRIVALFDPDRPDVPTGLLGLIISDYVAYYRATPGRLRWGAVGSYGHDSPRRLALLFIPRMVNSPCLHATALIRLATHTPRFLLGMWRTILIATHSIDISVGLDVGPGLVLPHPVGIVLGAGLRMGRNVTIMHHVSIGGLIQREEGRYSPRIGDDVVIYGHSMVLGPIAIGDGSIVGAGSWLAKDLGPGEVHRGQLAKAA